MPELPPGIEFEVDVPEDFVDSFGPPNADNYLDAAQDATKTMQESASAINAVLKPKPFHRKKRASSHKRDRPEHELLERVRLEEERRQRELRGMQSSIRDTPSASSSSQDKLAKAPTRRITHTRAKNGGDIARSSTRCTSKRDVH
jgi:hypothetical protein